MGAKLLRNMVDLAAHPCNSMDIVNLKYGGIDPDFAFLVTVPQKCIDLDTFMMVI